MAGLFGNVGNAANTAANTQGSISNDVALNELPTDSISDISFSRQSDHLSVTAWDNKTRIYEIGQTGTSKKVAEMEHQGPVLSTAWSGDGSKLVACGVEESVHILDVPTGQKATFGKHEAPIRVCRWIEIPSSQAPILVTGSWDKHIKYWDIRTPNTAPAAADITCVDRIYTLDTRKNLLVAGLADRYINLIDLSNPNSIQKTLQSPLKWQTRVVTCFDDGTGYAVGSIEGRCAINYIDEKKIGDNFSFKCHRDPRESTTTGLRNASAANQAQDCYSVNAISFHPVHGTFSTAGSNGDFHFWDKDAKHRLKGYPKVGGSIVATDFNRTGNIFAYAISYDWSQGYQGNNPSYPVKVMLHPVDAEEAKPRPKKGR